MEDLVGKYFIAINPIIVYRPENLVKVLSASFIFGVKVEFMAGEYKGGIRTYRYTNFMQWFTQKSPYTSKLWLVLDGLPY